MRLASLPRLFSDLLAATCFTPQLLVALVSCSDSSLALDCGAWHRLQAKASTDRSLCILCRRATLLLLDMLGASGMERSLPVLDCTSSARRAVCIYLILASCSSLLEA